MVLSYLQLAKGSIDSSINCLGVTIAKTGQTHVLSSVKFLLSEHSGSTYKTCAHNVLNTDELQWLEHLWDYESLFETGVV